MTRVGMNPARNRVSDYRPARTTAAVLVYIPYQEGYFKRRFDVLKLCLGSLLKNTRQEFDLMVFDNGSAPEVKAHLRSLQELGAIQYLITAKENIGKIGALRIMFEAAPGEIIAYADDDIFFYPGWLDEHLKLLDSFPKVGMVSGCAVRTLFDHGYHSNLRFAEAEDEVSLERGQNIPIEWELEWAESYGRDPEEHRKAIQDMEDILLIKGEVKAFAIANHNQFVTPRSVITKFMPEEWTGRLMGLMNELDNDVDQAGYLRLSTIDRTTKHMGNMVSEQVREEAARFGISVGGMTPSQLGLPRQSLQARILNWRPVRWLLQGLYNRLFWLLSQQSGTWLKPSE